MCQPMQTPVSSSCLNIKANASLRRSRQWKDRQSQENEPRRRRQQQTNAPTKNFGGRRRPNRKESFSSSVTDSTEQQSSASDDSIDGCSSSSSSFSLEVAPTKQQQQQQRRRRRRPNKSSRPQHAHVPTSIDDSIENMDEHEKSSYLAMDCEMVGIGPCGTTSRLARVVILNWHGETVYDAHVRVEEHITDYRTFVSGITATDLLESNGAVSFNDARARVLHLIQDKVLVGHGLKNDFAALGIWDHPWHNVRDTARYEPFMRIPKPEEYNPLCALLVPKKLKTLARDKLGRNIQVENMPHSPVEDAMAALELYKRHRVKWERAVQYKVERTREICLQVLRSQQLE